MVSKTLTAKPVTLDLGGPTVATWAYADSVPGPVLRATAGEFLRVTLDNQLPADTTIHGHGIRLRNAADGVPGVTQDPVQPGTAFVYEFTAPDAGTHWFHPHTGLQLDRGLYAPFIVDDPREPGDYDHEWIVVLDDWTDGVGGRPRRHAHAVTDGGSSNGGGMGGMDHGGMGGMSMGPPPWGDAGDITYPHFLVNGKVPPAPDVLNAKPAQRVRLRIINAASDTIFAVALAGHRMTITHSDGYAVQPREVSALYLGMGSGTTRRSPSPTGCSRSSRSRSASRAPRPGHWCAPGPAHRPPRRAAHRAGWQRAHRRAAGAGRRRPGCRRSRSTRPRT